MAAPELDHTFARPKLDLSNMRRAYGCWLVFLISLVWLADARASGAKPSGSPGRLRLIIETDAEGDPDDEQSLVRFLLYANEWDVEGIIANRPRARAGENENPERTGLGIVRRELTAYGQCLTNLLRHDTRYPSLDYLWRRTVPGYNETPEAVNLIVAAVDSDDPRPLWYSDWGTDHGAATNNLRRALDKILRERGPDGYAKFKARLRLVSADAFGEHTAMVNPPFPLWVDSFRPELDGKRWYHRFSALTATAGGFDIERDARAKHGPLGALYPLNTTHRQKEGDTMTFLYLVPTGMNDAEHPAWGSWAGRYGLNPNFSARAYYWANQGDSWRGTTNRDNTLARWSVALQNDFRARLDWCVADDFKKANHPPRAVLNGDAAGNILPIEARPGETVLLSSAGSTDPDGQTLQRRWFVYPEAGTYRGAVSLDSETGENIGLVAPKVEEPKTIHVILEVRDNGEPALFRFRRAIVTITP